MHHHHRLLPQAILRNHNLRRRRSGSEQEIGGRRRSSSRGRRRRRRKHTGSCRGPVLSSQATDTERARLIRAARMGRHDRCSPHRRASLLAYLLGLLTKITMKEVSRMR